MEDGISMERILNTWSETDRAYMQEAIALAERGRGHTAPNPMVGCVIVKDGRTIGRGYHHRYGDLHAERDALAACAEDPAGATMYVTLEPCCHHGKQPPCTDAILAAGIARVVVGATDPNPLVGGRGIALLRSGGVAVEAGLLEAEIREQNRIFLKYITQKRPWVSLKVAMTLDGKIATADGDARWVSSEAARAFVQQLRGQRSGICVGAGTVRLDDPMLNCRAEGYTVPSWRTRTRRRPAGWSACAPAASNCCPAPPVTAVWTCPTCSRASVRWASTPSSWRVARRSTAASSRRGSWTSITFSSLRKFWVGRTRKPPWAALDAPEWRTRRISTSARWSRSVPTC